MLKIKKDRFIGNIVLSIVLFALIFLATISYFLGWEYSFSTFIIYISIIASFIVIYILTILLYNFICNDYYIIDNNGIKFYKNNRYMFTMKREDIIQINYIRFYWIFTMQIGSGYLNIEYIGNDNIKPSITFENKKYYSISMSKKKSKIAAELLNIFIKD